MPVTDLEARLLTAIEEGLPLVSRPYLEVAKRLQAGEKFVIERLESLIARGIIGRFGVVVRHAELGYDANAMVVWDVPEERVPMVAAQMAAFPVVTLCYRRPRRLPVWPYNLFCMIHGRDRDTVLRQIDELRRTLALADVAYAVLFSRRRFKQRGARYGTPAREQVPG
jgi:DNA-binding Lrp family transcriptional regulator